MNIHARLVVAPTLALAQLPQELLTQSADVVHVVTAQIGIDDARRLTREASTKPVSAPYRSFVLCCDAITLEAQNALLKLFEEPPLHSVFYVIISHESRIIPTLRSRFVEVVRTESEALSAEATTFLTATHAERISMITAVHKEKNAQLLERLGSEVARWCATQTLSIPADALREVVFVETRLRIKGGSKKMLLEHLALALPASLVVH